MDRVDLSGSDLDIDIDLESGGTTSEEDSSTSHGLSCENSKNLSSKTRSVLMSSASLCESTKGGDCSSSYIISDEISAKNEEQLGKSREERIKLVHKTMDKEMPKKYKSANPSKPPRPPRGPSLDASDMKLLKEISDLNLKRKRMERIRTLKKIKKDKASSSYSNLIAFLVTIIFFLVIIFQGFLGSRM